MHSKKAVEKSFTLKYEISTRYEIFTQDWDRHANRRIDESDNPRPEHLTEQRESDRNRRNQESNIQRGEWLTKQRVRDKSRNRMLI